jgi:hypothetical protein
MTRARHWLGNVLRQLARWRDEAILAYHMGEDGRLGSVPAPRGAAAGAARSGETWSS